MYSLTIAFGDTPAMWRLLFKTEEAAHTAWTKAADPENKGFNVTDDFGQTCSVKNRVGLMLEDLDQSKLAGVEMMLHNARTQAQAQVQARSEPALRNAAQQGPSVFVPGMNGRMS
jgi:hypothetical protein